jgi:hypothetical protein
MSAKKNMGENKSEVRIGLTDIASELSFDSPSSATEIREAVTNSLVTGSPLILSDIRGREIIVAASKIGFVEIGEQAERRVGFGTD